MRQTFLDASSGVVRHWKALQLNPPQHLRPADTRPPANLIDRHEAVLDASVKLAAAKSPTATGCGLRDEFRIR